MALLCRSRSTHWKQTVVYLEDTITICQGEVITGQPHLRCMKSQVADVVGDVRWHSLKLAHE